MGYKREKRFRRARDRKFLLNLSRLFYDLFHGEFYYVRGVGQVPSAVSFLLPFFLSLCDIALRPDRFVLFARWGFVYYGRIYRFIYSVYECKERLAISSGGR